MLWSLSRRWYTYRPHLEIRRFLVFIQSPSSAIRPTSSASATTSPRPDPTLSATRRQSLGHKQCLPVSEKETKRDGCTTVMENVTSPLIPASSLSEGLVPWLDVLFAAGLPSQEHIREQLDRKQDWMQVLGDGETVCRAADELARTNVPQRALYILHAAHSLGLAFKQNVYERIAYRLATLREWKAVLSVVEIGKSVTKKTTVRLLNWRARSLVNVQNYAELNGILEEFAKYGLKPQRRTFMLILQGHLRNHDLARAKATISDMETAGFPITPATYSVIIPAYRRFGLDAFIRDQGYDFLRSNCVRRGREKILNGLLQLHLHQHDLDGALQLLETYGSLSKVSDDNSSAARGAPESATDKTSVSRLSPKAHRATYNILINYLSKYGPESLTGILKRMRSCGITPDIKVGAALIRMYYSRGEEHQALVILRDCCNHHDLCTDTLQSLGYQPLHSDPSVFAPFVGRPSTELFNAVLHGAIRTRGLAATLSVLKLMQNARLKPNNRTFETFLWHLSRERPIITEDLVEILRSLLSTRVDPTLTSLNIILRSIVNTAKRSKYQEGWNALGTYVRLAIESMKLPESERDLPSEEQRTEPTFDPELCVTDLQSRMFREVLGPLVTSLRRRRVLADRATFSLRMRYDSFTLRPSRTPEAVARNLQIMRDRGLYPNVYHYAALMEAHCGAGNIRAAHEVLQNAIQGGLIPRKKSIVILYTILISANARIGRPDLALNVFREMLNANVAPDMASIDTLVGAFFAVKAFRLARRVLLDLWPMVAPFPMEIRDAPLIDLIKHLRSIRDQAEAPRRGFKKPTALSRQELVHLSREIVAKWNDVLEAQHEDGGRWDNHAKEDVTPQSDVVSEAKAQQMGGINQ